MAVSREGQSAVGSEPPVLVGILDGLIDRVQRSPLMRRPPAQCTPEELQTLSTLLSDLLSLRQTRSAVENLAGPRIDQITTYWPELGTLLAASRRATPAARARGRDTGVPTTESGGPFETGSTSEADSNGQIAAQPAPPASSAKPVEIGSRDLAHLLLEALTVQGRALNTTQMLAWLSERGTLATREEVTTTLFRHEELFRKRGPGHWVVAGQEVT